MYKKYVLALMPIFGMVALLYANAQPMAHPELGPPSHTRSNLTYWFNCPPDYFYPIISGDGQYDVAATRIGIKFVGYTTDNRRVWSDSRVYCEIPLGEHTLPYGSTIKYVELSIPYTADSVHFGDLDVVFYKYFKNIEPPDAEYPEMLRSTSWTASDSIGIGYGSNGLITAYFDEYSSFVDSVQSALLNPYNDNVFTLAMRCLQPVFPLNDAHYWNINNAQISIEIGFLPPMQDNIEITNVIYGIEDYQDQYSAVRADENVYLPDGTLDRSVVPAFATPPIYRDWYLATDHVVETLRNRYNDVFDGEFEKHHHWNTYSSAYWVDWTIHAWGGEDNKFEAHSEDVKHADVEVTIEEEPRTGVQFSRRDPWSTFVTFDVFNGWQQTTYSGQFETYPSPYDYWTDMKSLGVFLDQEPYEPNLNIPYYSLRASNLLRYNGGAWQHLSATPLYTGDGVFIDWRSEDPLIAEVIADPNPAQNIVEYTTKAVVYKQDDATVTARYKGHLISNTPASDWSSIGPTATNNQRKLDIVESSDGSAVTHGVYESMGEVWYITSTDNGVTWSPEVLISSGNGTASRPSIDATEEYIAFTYVEDGAVHVRWLNYAGFQPQHHIFSDASDDPAPVIAQHNHVYAGGTYFYETMLAYENNSDAVTWVRFDDRYVASSGNFSISPAMRPSLIDLSSQRYAVAFLSGDDLYHSVYTDPYLTNNFQWCAGEEDNPPVCTMHECLPVDLQGYKAMGAPSLSKHRGGSGSPGQLVVAVEGGENCLSLNPFSAIIIVHGVPMATGKRCYLDDNTTWSTVQVLVGPTETERLWAPSVSCLNEIPVGGIDHIRCAYNYTPLDCSGGGGSNFREVHVSSYENGMFGFDTQVLDALHPSAIESPSLGNGLDMHTVFNTPFYPSTEIAFSSYMLNKKKVPTRSRELILTLDTTELRIGLADLRIDNGANPQAVSWKYSLDTLYAGRNISVEEKFRTNAFVVPHGNPLKLYVRDLKRGIQQFPTGCTVTLQLVDDATDQVLAVLASLDVNNLVPGNHAGTQAHLLNAYAGRNVYLRLSISGLTNAVHLGEIDYYSMGQGASYYFPKSSSDVKSSWTFTPESLQLEQNHPNPFNPTTEIVYTLPETDNVKLTVYDKLGKEVCILVNGLKPAGTHVVTFDAADLPSGMYLYRIETAKGSVSKKMMLMK